jgi:hypothetical protein
MMFDMPQKLIDFLCAAYQMPMDIRAKILEENDSLEDRNSVTIALLLKCFLDNYDDHGLARATKDLTCAEEKLMDNFLQLSEEQQARLITNFLATAVLLTYT